MKKVILMTGVLVGMVALHARAQSGDTTRRVGSGAVKNDVTQGKAPSALGTTGMSGATGSPSTYTEGPSTRRAHRTGSPTGRSGRTKATRSTTRRKTENRRTKRDGSR